MTDERIIAYLLRELPEAEIEQFEEELFAANEWPPELRSAEDDLIDDYLRNELSADRRQRFEEFYLWSDARRERVAMAAALLREVDPPPEPEPAPRPHWWQLWFGLRLAGAAAVLLLMIGVVWFVGFRDRSGRALARLDVSVVEGTRGDGGSDAKFSLQSGFDQLELHIKLPAGVPGGTDYQVQMEAPLGREIGVPVSRREGDRLVVIVPVSELKPGRYKLKVYSIANGQSSRIPGTGGFSVQ